MDLALECQPRQAVLALPAGLGAQWRRFVVRRQHRRDLRKLARLGPRLLADAGFDEADVRTAVAGTWDDPELRRLLSRLGPG